MVVAAAVPADLAVRRMRRVHGWAARASASRVAAAFGLVQAGLLAQAGTVLRAAVPPLVAG